MADVPEVTTSSAEELLAVGRRHLAVRDYHAATESLAKACEVLAKTHGDIADECGEAYLWYGKALLGLSREESGVLGGGIPGDIEDDENEDENDENGDEESKEQSEMANGEVEKSEAESTTKEEEPASSTAEESEEKPGTSNGDQNDDSAVNLENDDDVDNLQLAWEMLELSRSILQKRAADGGSSGRALLADVHLALGEVALESETYDKAVLDMVSCLEIQKELYGSDDRRIAETHYQIGLANSLASNFEDAITHFKNAANILESRIKTLENPSAAAEDATVKKYTNADPLYSVEAELKELKELLPEIQEKIQDMMDYKAEMIKRVRETLCPSNGESQSSSAGVNKLETKSAPSDISHLIKRKRKSSESEETSAPKRINT
ncbi:unnamed protein product [Euphydryas editha]|uniref:Tetratricopeptide SHNi-TPR domain-containing protein n=1 Tax=Euphydryas editha TaxID=104508 RepID=A0AAU9V7W8_EUPED|nr:unnamed protein product [Euphydryas editha]